MRLALPGSGGSGPPGKAKAGPIGLAGGRSSAVQGKVDTIQGQCCLESLDNSFLEEIQRFRCQCPTSTCPGPDDWDEFHSSGGHGLPDEPNIEFVSILPEIYGPIEPRYHDFLEFF